MPPTEKQILGKAGEIFVIRNCDCPKCKHSNTLRLLPPNFKCADVICDFCGYLAQVKTATSKDVGKLPKILFGAAWGVQKDRMAARYLFPSVYCFSEESERVCYLLSACRFAN
jgi:type II restriction enzyme